MAHQQQDGGEGDAAVRAANAHRQPNTGRRNVGIFIAILTSLAVEGLITQLRLGSGTEDDMPGQLVVRPDGVLVELGRDGVDHTTQWLRTIALTKLKLLARLAVYAAAVTMALSIFAAKRPPQTVADKKASKEKEEAIAALQESQEAHSTLQEEQIVLKEKLTVLEAKAMEATQRAADAEGQVAAETLARRDAEAALRACREEGLGAREENVAARAETVAAREETVGARTTLAETERIVDALTVSNREAERERGEMAAVLQQLEEKHAALAKCLAEETGRGDAVRREQAATRSALEVAEAALTVSQLEAVAAQAGALAEKERAADALSVLKRDTSDSLERVVRENTVKTKLAEKDKVETAGAIRDLQREIVELKGNVKDEKRRVYAANMAMQQLKKKKAELDEAEATAAKIDAKITATRRTPTMSECEAAIRDGDIDVLKRAIRRSKDRFDAIRKNEKACSSAARNGHLEVLQWLRATGCPWNEKACFEAADNRQLETLQWLRANGCPWDSVACSRAAARNGHLEVLQWLRATGCRWDERVCSGAAGDGHLEVLQWLRANNCPWDSLACSDAARNGHLEVLQWLRAKGCPWNQKACSAAAENGHLEVLQWLRANGCPWHRWVCSTGAARNGNLEVLQWLKADGCPGRKCGCSEQPIADRSYLFNTRLLWGKERCPWGKWTCSEAARGGHLEVLQWLRATGCPWDKDACSTRAARNGHVDVVQLLRANGCP